MRTGNSPFAWATLLKTRRRVAASDCMLASTQTSRRRTHRWGRQSNTYDYFPNLFSEGCFVQPARETHPHLFQKKKTALFRRVKPSVERVNEWTRRLLFLFFFVFLCPPPIVDAAIVRKVRHEPRLLRHVALQKPSHVYVVDKHVAGASFNTC